MRVIILAAGQSKRFLKAGYKTPKPFLKIEWYGTTMTMLEHVINTIPLEFNQFDVAIPTGYEEKSYESFRSLNLGRKVNLHTLDVTKGPADSARQVLENILPDSCLIMDTDILNSTNDLLKLTKLSHCGVLVRRSENPAYSYVDRLGEFHHIKEKERISEYAVQGAYFIPKNQMVGVMAVITKIIEVIQEPFMSHVFDSLPLMKFAVPTTYVPIDWGTPQDVEMSGAKIITTEEPDAHH